MTDIPYFDGDFWPNMIEETIKELDQEAKQREASEKDMEVCVPNLPPSNIACHHCCFFFMEAGHNGQTVL